MDKKAMFAIVAIVTIGIVLSAAAVGAWEPIKPDKPVPPETPPADATVNALAGEIADVMGSEAEVAAITSMLTQAQILGLDLTDAAVMGDASGADVSASDVGIVVPGDFVPVHIWPYWGWPGPRIKTAIAWDECNSNLNMLHLAPFGLSISDADNTLTEATTMLNPFGIGLIIVTKPPWQTYVLVFDSY